MTQTPGSWAAIIGGSEGIGASFAMQLAQKGFNIVLIARRPEPLETFASQIRNECPVEVRTLAIDITSDDAVNTIAVFTHDLEVSHLVCNAGAFYDVADYVDRPFDSARAMITLNIVAPSALAHHFGSKMRDRGKGNIIFIGSAAGITGNARTAVYAASKAYLQIFAEGLWREMKPHGVKVLALVLGLANTPGFKRAWGEVDTGDIPVAEPDDIARQGLECLDQGPIRYGEGMEQLVQMVQGMPRDQAVNMMSQSTAGLTSPSAPRT